MTSRSRRYLVAYDVTDDRRRATLAQVLSRHGDRIQYSVFVIDARDTRVVRLEREMKDIIDTKEDSILICDLGPHHGNPIAGLRFIGQRRLPTSHGPQVL